MREEFFFMFKRLRADINAAKRNDPAARNKFEILFTYSGVHALSWHRWANRLYRMHLKLLARITSQFAKFLTGIEIHPAAKIEGGVFIDHGMGVVIGETAEVASGVVIYQGVTLGGTGKDKGKRHPTIQKDVVISSGAKVLGGFTVGEGARIGAGAVVLKEVPPHATVVGVPARVVRIRGEKIDLQQENATPTPRRSAPSNAACTSWKRLWKSSRAKNSNARRKSSSPSRSPNRLPRRKRSPSSRRGNGPKEHARKSRPCKTGRNRQQRNNKADF